MCALSTISFLRNIFLFSGKYTILKSHKRGYALNLNCAKKQIHWVGLFSFNNFRNKYFWFLWIEFRSSCCLSFKRKLVACNEFSFLQNNIYCLTKNLRSHGFLHDMLLQNTQNWKYKYIINIEKSYFKSSKFIFRYNEIIWTNRIIIISMLNDVLFFYYSSIIWYAWNEQLCQQFSMSINGWENLE